MAGMSEWDFMSNTDDGQAIGRTAGSGSGGDPRVVTQVAQRLELETAILVCAAQEHLMMEAVAMI